ncbi:hypothetical protein KIH87_02800 [Paraneptunicella aestuarii]|uniref:hypothetical protein n=1 Tax=Paraneptunicella aestuarii TaxID=2831148 RepID=UPI001E4D08C2|nr:hypothetical protein [Paraneptunicella aestuarii]UAA39310.1 hypothetical protein KIH87_02800 [Paraneptunicella aestuarii]
MNFKKVLCLMALILLPGIGAADENVSSLNAASSQSFCLLGFCFGGSEASVTGIGSGDPPGSDPSISGPGSGNPPGGDPVMSTTGIGSGDPPGSDPN